MKLPPALQERLNRAADACRTILPAPNGGNGRAAAVFLLLFLLFAGLHLLCAKGVSLAVDRLNRTGPVSVTLRGVEPAAFPPGVLASECLVHNRETGVLVRINDLVIRPSLTALASGGFGLGLYGTMGDGSVEAVLRTQGFTDFKSLSFSATVEGVHLEKTALARAYFPTLHGVISGVGSLDTDGNGTLDLLADGLRTTFHFPALNGYPVMRGNLRADLTSGVVQVRSLRLHSGAGFEITAQGSLRPRWRHGPDADMRLDGTLLAPAGRLRPDIAGAAQSGPRRFTLQGSMAAPRYTFR